MLKYINKFLKNTSGSILPTMAILTVPLAIAAGAAVDYSRYVNMKNDVQTGLDAANIAAVAELPNILSAIPSNLQGAEYNAEVERRVQAYADRFLKANITSSTAKDAYELEVTFIPETIGNSSGVQMRANIEYDTIFGGLNGEDGGILLTKDVLSERITSLVNTGNRTVEVALVVDNSGSMAFNSGNLASPQNPAAPDDRRLKKLQTAASDLVKDVFKASENSLQEKPVQFSLVPFSSSVNVGNLDHENHDDNNNFLDINGFSSSHNENLDWKNTYRTKSGETVQTINNNRTARLVQSNGSTRYLTRFDVYRMLGTEWEGCVEMRPWPHNVRDTYRSNTLNYNQNSSERLFVPYLVPDGPDPSYNEFFSDSSYRVQTSFDNPSSGTRNYSNNYIPDFFDYDADQDLAFPRYVNDNLFTENRITNDDINGNQLTRINWLSKYQAFQGLGQDEINDIDTRTTKGRQHRDILNGITKPTFTKNLDSRTSSYYADSGPNAFCPDLPLLQLTDDEQKILDNIDLMEAHGGTNIQIGLTWGWRTLSNRRPFNTGRALSDSNNLKILILLTDGNNQMLPEDTPNNTQYTAWGFYRDDNVLKHATANTNTHRRLRVGINANLRKNTIYESQFSLNINPTTQSDFEDLMNLHTNQACNNIKNDGITIYTIAFDVAPGGKVKELLENCAGSGKINNNEIVRSSTFYYDVVGSELKDTFAEISSAITAIRLAQ